MFSPIKAKNNNTESQCSIAYKFEATGSRTNLIKSKSKTTLVKGVSTSALVKQNTSKKVKLTHQSAYNLNKYKT